LLAAPEKCRGTRYFADLRVPQELTGAASTNDGRSSERGAQSLPEHWTFQVGNSRVADMERDERPSHLTARDQLDTLHADGAAGGTRAAAPLWYLIVQSLCVAGFAASFSLENWQAAGFALSAVALVLLGMLRPAITGTRIDPWAHKASTLVGLVMTAFILIMMSVGAFVLAPSESATVLVAVALGTFSGTLALGIWMERAFSRSVAEAN
jgi:hypothetical protein